MSDPMSTRHGRTWLSYRLLAAHDSYDIGIKESAEKYSIDVDLLKYWRKKVEDPTFHPLQIGGGHHERSFPIEIEESVKQTVDDLFRLKNDLFIDELIELIGQIHGIYTSTGTMSFYLDKWGYSKKVGSPISRRKFSLENTQYYLNYIEFMCLQTNRFDFFYVDEVSFCSAGMVNKRGWSKKNVRVIVIEDDRFQTSFNMTLITSIRHGNAPVFYTVRNHTSNQYDYCNFVIEAMRQGYLVNGMMMYDNARTHEALDSFPILEGVSMLPDVNVRLVQLPKYSPELNPCELVFHCLKEYIRFNRTHGNILPLVHHYLQEVLTQQMVINMYEHCIDCRFRVDKIEDEQ